MNDGCPTHVLSGASIVRALISLRQPIFGGRCAVVILQL
ncbi:hypothetical protein ADILRU_0033 [Leifsonia rubra CMS 76R]|nr:hypothetical protein ADILRU_0033 [Leifsonia rubra CMS 76R]